MTRESSFALAGDRAGVYVRVAVTARNRHLVGLAIAAPRPFQTGLSIARRGGQRCHCVRLVIAGSTAFQMRDADARICLSHQIRRRW